MGYNRGLTSCPKCQRTERPDKAGKCVLRLQPYEITMPTYPTQEFSSLNTRTLLLIILVILLNSCGNGGEETRIRAGRLQDFPVGAVIPIELKTSFLDPDPPAIGSQTPGVVTQPVSVTVSPIPVYLIHDPVAGILALYNRDPHLGCQVAWEEEIQHFVNPCHGQQYSLTGECIMGSCPRGLDRFKVIVTEEGEVWVDVSDFQLGPPRK